MKTKQTYMNEQKEKILEFAKKMRKSGEITEGKIQEVYYYNFVKK